MKKLWFILAIGIIFIMPRVVEAKEYDLTRPYTYFPSGYGSFTLEVEPGDVLKISNAYFVQVCDPSGHEILSGNYYGSVLEYTILSYEELTGGQSLPENKKMIISVNASSTSTTADTIGIYYTLVDDLPKEVIYHNTYDAENNNPTSYYEEETDILLTDISRNGYKFLGWYTSPTFEEDTRVTMISKDESDVLELYAKWEKIEEVGDSNEDNIFTNPETNSTSYILIGILSIAILGTVLTIVYRIRKVGE